MVNLSPDPSRNVSTVCTDPFPKEVVPSTRARLWSCSAPTTISEALALPPLIRATIGYVRLTVLGLAGNSLVFLLILPLMDRIIPSSIKRSETLIA